MDIHRKIWSETIKFILLFGSVKFFTAKLYVCKNLLHLTCTCVGCAVAGPLCPDNLKPCEKCFLNLLCCDITESLNDNTTSIWHLFLKAISKEDTSLILFYAEKIRDCGLRKSINLSDTVELDIES